MGVYLVLVLACLEVQFLVELLVVVEMVVAGGEDRQMEQTQSSLELFLVEDPQAVTVGGGEDKLLARISQTQGSLDWRIFLVGEVTTAVTVATITILVTTTTTASVGMTSPSKTRQEIFTVHAGGQMRQAGGGAILQAMAAVMPGSHRGFLTILGHTRLVEDKARNRGMDGKIRKKICKYIYMKSLLRCLCNVHLIHYSLYASSQILSSFSVFMLPFLITVLSVSCKHHCLLPNIYSCLSLWAIQQYFQHGQ